MIHADYRTGRVFATHADASGFWRATVKCQARDVYAALAKATGELLSKLEKREIRS